MFGACCGITGQYDRCTTQGEAKKKKTGLPIPGAHLREDVSRLLASHHRNPGVGPHEEEAGRVGPAAHAVVARSVAAADDAGYLRHRSARHGGDQLGAVLSYTLVLVTFSDLSDKAWGGVHGRKVGWGGVGWGHSLVGCCAKHVPGICDLRCFAASPFSRGFVEGVLQKRLSMAASHYRWEQPVLATAKSFSHLPWCCP